MREINKIQLNGIEQETSAASASRFCAHFCLGPTLVCKRVCGHMDSVYWSYSVSVHRRMWRLWVMLMSGSRVVISEPQAGRPEAAKQLVIWCGLRYRSLGVKLCASEPETCRGPSETPWSSHLCAEGDGTLVSRSLGNEQNVPQLQTWCNGWTRVLLLAEIRVSRRLLSYFER